MRRTAEQPLVLATGIFLLVTASRSLSSSRADTPTDNPVDRIQGVVYFVAPTGSPDGNGTPNRPWPSLSFALAKVGGGKTIVLAPGIYTGPIQLPASYRGTKTRPTRITCLEKWKACVIGSPDHAIDIAEGCDWVVIDGLQVMGGRSTGIKTYAHHTTIRNCWVHHNALQGIEAHHVNGFALERSLVEYNGSNPRWSHGVYADGAGHRYWANVVRHNSSHGLHLYPELIGSEILSNLCYDNTTRQILVSAGSKTTDVPNRILNNTCAGGTIGIGLFGRPTEKPNLIFNNICVRNALAPIFLQFDHPTALVDHNLLDRTLKTTEVPSAMIGEHNVVQSRPQFADSAEHLYWLRADSPARGIGQGLPSREQLLDFYGRILTHPSPDAGAFQFDVKLWKPDVRKEALDWYTYSLSPAEGIPDLWSPPITTTQATP